MCRPNYDCPSPEYPCRGATSAKRALLESIVDRAIRAGRTLVLVDPKEDDDSRFAAMLEAAKRSKHGTPNYLTEGTDDA